MTKVPYESARSGQAARDETTKLLRRFGCESVGFMDDFDEHSVLLVFKHRGRQVQLRASAKGWAAMFVKAHETSRRRSASRQRELERKALLQGYVAINSILRDWVKGQVTAVECGVLQFEAVFLPYMLCRDGSTVIDKVMAQKMLPAPAEAA